MHNAGSFHDLSGMLEAIDLECVRGERRLFAGIGVCLRERELLHLKGGNGSGKTSLLRMLCGLLPPAGGSICWRGQAIGKLGEDYRRELCFFGHHNAIKDELTPQENLLAAAGLAGTPLDRDQALAALEELGMAGYEDLPCRYLSQGQKRRVALARLVNERRPLWLLDEPFVALDAAAVEHVAGLIAAHVRRGGLAILTTHQPVDIGVETQHQLTLGASPPC